MSSPKKKTHSRATDKKEIYVAFSGGGAKAFIHIGALSFLEEKHRVVGVSGTSAGAIVAVLKAAGFSSKDMFVPNGNSSGESPLFNTIKKRNKNIKSIHQLLGKEGLNGLKSALSYPAKYIFKRASILQKTILILTFLILVLAIPVAITSVIYPTLSYSQYILAILLCLASLWAWLKLIAAPTALNICDNIFTNGIACTEKAILEIEHHVSIRLGVKNRKVLMGDFKIPIRIIAANLDKQEHKIFSNNRTPDTPLRDALSSSICIPIAFKPHFYNGDRYVDGGIVSNMPAFVFAEELALHPERRVVALRIKQEVKKTKPKKWGPRACDFISRHLGVSEGSGSYSRTAASNLVQTLFSGAQDLAHGEMDVITPELPTKLELLDFDLTFENMSIAYTQGQDFAKKLVSQSFKAEEIFNATCKKIADNAENEIDKINLLKRRSGGSIRVAVAYSPYIGSGVMRIKHSYGFEHHSDRNVVLPISASVCGKAWKDKVPVFEFDNKKIVGSLSKFSHISSLIEKNIQWILAVPILDTDGATVRFVINIDSNTKITDTIYQGVEKPYRIVSMLRNLIGQTELIGKGMRDTLDSFDKEV